jgi:hypothetical protein
VSVVLDYLYGSSAEALISAIGAIHSDRRVRLVNIGSMAGHSIPLPAVALRSTALELMGSGLGSVSDLELVRSIGEGFAAAKQGGFAVEIALVKMSDAERAWSGDYGQKRLVCTL